MDRRVEASDLGVFADWDFESEKFENINPKIKRVLRNIFKKTLDIINHIVYNINAVQRQQVRFCA